MNKRVRAIVWGGVFLLAVVCSAAAAIDRRAVVSRHDVSGDGKLGILPIGNGGFCFGADETGLQTLGGVCMARWAWHSFPMPEGTTEADIPPNKLWLSGRITGAYEPDPEKKKSPLFRWMRENPHAFNFGRIHFVRANGQPIKRSSVAQANRTLTLWTGFLNTDFTLDGVPVHVETCVHPAQDTVAVRIVSPALTNGLLNVVMDFGYPNFNDKEWKAWNLDFTPGAGGLTEQLAETSALVHLKRTVDAAVYYVRLATETPGARLVETEGGRVCTFRTQTPELALTCTFSAHPVTVAPVSFAQTREAAAAFWERFWMTGGAIDLSESRDSRWKELERRVVLSQYHMNAQGSGAWPNGEVGLLKTDFWGTRFHMEMTVWHLAHDALWGRIEKSDQPLACYQTLLPVARGLAKQLGYTGAFWPKSVGPDGRSSPWAGVPVLLWRQPHPLFFAELEYRVRPTRATLEKWAEVVEDTADFMADFPTLDPATGLYSLRPCMPSSELGVTYDTVYELAYWRWGLKAAQNWRERMGLPRVDKWETVRTHLAPLTVRDGCYERSPEWTDTYTTRNFEHPDPVGVFGLLPPVEGVDPLIAGRSVKRVMEVWDWEKKSWGWDFPWVAMCAARTGQPKLALDALLSETPRNGYDARGLCEGWYMPGNGGLLYAVAMMAAGWDGAPARPAPGFPDDGSWTVRWEGFSPAP